MFFEFSHGIRCNKITKKNKIHTRDVRPRWYAVPGSYQQDEDNAAICSPAISMAVCRLRLCESVSQILSASLHQNKTVLTLDYV